MKSKFMSQSFKFIMIVLMLAAMITLNPRQAKAADNTVRYNGNDYTIQTSGDYGYIVVDKEAVIMQFNSTTASVTIPSELGGFPVTVIGCSDNWGGKGAFQDNTSMQTVTIPSSVKVIDERAFKNCSGLQQVLVGKGVTTIGIEAFSDCSYMQRIQFNGNTLKEIGEKAFFKCIALDNLTLPQSLETIGDSAFKHCTALSGIVIPDSVTSLGGGAFGGCTVLEEAVIGNGVTALTTSGSDFSGYDGWKDGAFENCTGLLSVTLGTGIETIGIDAFNNTALLKIDIPDNVVNIEAGAFQNCTQMTKVNIGKGCKLIGEHCFSYCTSLQEVNFNDNVRTIGNCAFKKDVALNEINIPSSVTSLGGGSFAGCTSLKSAVIGNGVKELLSSGSEFSGYDGWKDGMFEQCTSLTEVTIGDGVETIGVDAFTDTKIKSITIPDSVITIMDGAFCDCKELTNVYIGEGVTSIGEKAFFNNISLKDIYIGHGVVSIGSKAFSECDALEYLLIPSCVTSLGGGLCAGDNSLVKVVIGNGVTDLTYSGSNYGGSDTWKDGIFEECIALIDVSIGSGLTSIGVDTFANTAVKSVLIPSKVSVINQGAFYNSAITNLYFTGTAPTLDSKLFGSSATPLMYKLKNKIGYDNIGYTISDFTPIKVTFDLNDSDVFAIQPNDQYLMPEGGYVIEPISPMAEGYVFEGWYADSDCKKEWSFLNNRVSEDTTIYAKWEKVGEVPPDRPADLEEESVSQNSITVSWSSAIGATGYYVYVNGEKVTEAAISETKYTVGNLECDTVYEINVVAVNSAGNSNMSLTKVVATLEGSAYKLGDVDKDGDIDATDALLVLQHSAKIKELEDTAPANTNTDDVIDASDALNILKVAAKLLSQEDLPVAK